MEESLWTPSIEKIKDANLTVFMKKTNFHTYEDLYQWSIKSPEKFWESVWDFCKIISQSKGDVVLANSQDIIKASFFPQAHLNYAENLLRRRDEATAIRFFNEKQEEISLTYKELYEQVSKLIQQFKEWDIQPGDRIAGYLPNLPQTVIAMLATTAVGAIWSSCSPDFGIQGLIDRFLQIQPKVLIVVDGYHYAGKTFNCLERLPEIVKAIPSIEHSIVIPYISSSSIHSYKCWHKIQSNYSRQNIEFEQFPFNHPLFILYSSGTTGVPKCIVHGAGGTLLQHLKEHQLHCDIKPNDRVFFFTTCGWMMWNWLVSCLASEAQIILYDGSPTHPTFDHLFDIAEKTQMTFFGTSAKYLGLLQKNHFKPRQNLDALRTIASTGSPLAADTFKYIYSSIKSDVHLASISGGTDIISCFMLGNPIKPVWAGQIQTAGLGLKLDVFNEEGKPIKGEQGELVCTAPFPSRPLKFWNDDKREKYYQSYFNHYPNIWHHGDLIELTEQEGFIMHGRSDAILKPGGVRIGTAEIYRQVEKLPEILESLATAHHHDDDDHIILFVILKNELTLSDEMISNIKSHIRSHTTPRHVPSQIIQVKDLPRTFNGKLAELAVRQIIHGQEVKNIQALVNPECLEEFKRIREILLKN